MMHHLITDHLDVWTTARQPQKKGGRDRGKASNRSPHGIQKLRELILELAVRGKLVPQDPNDEPASELLKSIAAEKAKLIKEGEIKKQKNFLEIADDEKPFAIPEDWEWARISEIGHDWGQTTPTEPFTYLDVSAIDNGRGKITSPAILSPEEAPSRAKKIVRKGTVIYSTVRPYLKNISVVDAEYDPLPIASTAFAVVHPYLDMPGRFISIFLRSPIFVRYVESVQTGIAYPAINDKQFFSGVFPLPPKEEQMRIVAKVDELMALCDKLEEEQTESAEAHQVLVQTLLDTLTQAVTAMDGGNAENAGAIFGQGEFNEAWQRIEAHFDTLFTTEASIDQLRQTILQLAVIGRLVPQDPNDEPATNSKKVDAKADIKVDFEVPHGWVWTNLNSLANINGGFAFKSSNYNEEGVRVVRISDFDEFGFKDHKVVRHPFSPEYGRFSLANNDILMAMTGGTVGKSLLVKSLPEPMVVNQRVATIKVSDSVSPSYIDIVIRSEMTQEVIRKAKNSTNDNISMSDIKSFAIPVPPITEQHRIVAKVDELMALCDDLKARLQEAQTVQIHLADAIVEQAII